MYDARVGHNTVILGMVVLFRLLDTAHRLPAAIKPHGLIHGTHEHRDWQCSIYFLPGSVCREVCVVSCGPRATVDNYELAGLPGNAMAMRSYAGKCARG